MSEKYQETEHCYLRLSHVFLNQKKLILVTMLVVTLFWGLYIYAHKTTYQASVLIGPLRTVDNSHFLSTPLKEYWDITKLYELFSVSMHSLSVRKLFYQQVVVPYGFTLIERSSLEHEQYYIAFTHDNPAGALECIKKFIAIINKCANEQLALAIARKKIDGVLANKTKRSSLNVVQSGVENIQVSSIIIAQQLSSMQLIDLFHYDSPVILSSTMLESKLTSTLVLGIIGGLILGFFIATLRIGWTEKR